MRRPSITFLIFLAAAIYVVWVALSLDDRWPFRRVFDVSPGFRQVIFFRDLSDSIRAGISPHEAHLLWVIRDPEPADGTFDTFARNFGTMLRRASPSELPVVIPLDILMSATGESFTLIRLIAVVWDVFAVDKSFTWITLIGIVAAGLILGTAAYVLLPLLIAVQVRRHRRRPTLWPLLFGGLFVCAVFTCFFSLIVSVIYPFTCGFGYPDNINSAVDAYLTEHAAGDPVITIFEEDSRFAHFAATQDLRLGNRIDLSEREYTSSEINAIIGDIDNDRIWILFERDAPHLDRNLDAVLAAIAASHIGVPFLRGPISFMGTPERSDHWSIFGYDANSNVFSPRGTHPPYCFG
jgi:hypothetical protein